jgi:hypothetical protein
VVPREESSDKMSLTDIPLFVITVLVIVGVIAGLLARWLFKHHTILVYNEDMFWTLQPRCTCGEIITGCSHRFGVPSTWEHLRDGRHYHYDEEGRATSMVEHA